MNSSNIVMPSTKDRMYCYLWEDQDDKNECKFGERFVLAGQDPATECTRRVRQSLGVRKDRFDEGKIKILSIWDVSDIGKSVGKNHKGGKVDDFLRAKVGYRKGTTGEVHRLSGKEMKIKVDTLIDSYGQDLIVAGLSTLQYEIGEQVIDMHKQGRQVVLAELCARFGKTIWSGAVAVEEEANVVIVASYVKTVFTSFASDLTSFKQFVGYEHVDTSDADYQERINDAITKGKKVFAYLSLCNGENRQKRIDYLFNVNTSKMLIVDEADFGAHTEKQALPLVEKVKENPDVNVIIMTGTNADRAVTYWPVNDIVSVTYPELLMQKRETENA